MEKFKILAVSDIHGRVDRVRTLIKLRETTDFLLIAGDITNFGGRREAIEVLSPLLDAWDGSVLAVFGNCDGRDVPELLEELGISVHMKHAEISGLGVTGFGGSSRTPFGTPFEFEESEIFEGLSSSYVEGDVLLTHAPPYGTRLDVTSRGVHAGSRAVREFIERFQPPLAVCGHIHEAAGIEKIGGSTVINPGPLMWGYYSILTVDENLQVISAEIKKF